MVVVRQAAIGAPTNSRSGPARWGPPEETANMVQISENAANLIRKMTEKNGISDGGLRIGIRAGGCSGLSYTFTWEAAPRVGDHVFEGTAGSRVFIEPRSFQYIDGTTLDYDTSLVSKGFIFNNPNAKSSCGCGTSFSI